ncbi:uncharacterized protein UTRI_10153 [Ustilago trichophora]|uniref:Uncharacterized protein n=1 Tax=Ustilago trichophora TaxID=86804 RepID=A0A5C3E7Z1_9BASI|nr:uncharacterized protein UTRI_10153 [Ustilago trichophora]
MRLPSTFPLVLTCFLGLANFALCIPLGPGSSLSAAEKAVQEAGDDAYLAAFHAANTKPRQPFSDWYATMDLHRNPPNEGRLKPATSEQKFDLRDTYWVRLKEIERLGFFGRDSGFLGRTPQGRLVFAAPKFHELALWIPHKGSTFNEELIAMAGHNGKPGTLYHLGWSKARGMGPTDDHRDIAIKVGEDKWLVKDDVPINRIASTRVGKGFDWSKKTELSPPMEANVMTRFEGPEGSEIFDEDQRYDTD